MLNSLAVDSSQKSPDISSSSCHVDVFEQKPSSSAAAVVGASDSPLVLIFVDPVPKLDLLESNPPIDVALLVLFFLSLFQAFPLQMFILCELVPRMECSNPRFMLLIYLIMSL